MFISKVKWPNDEHSAFYYKFGQWSQIMKVSKLGSLTSPLAADCKIMMSHLL